MFLFLHSEINICGFESKKYLTALWYNIDFLYTKYRAEIRLMLIKNNNKNKKDK